MIFAGYFENINILQVASDDNMAIDVQFNYQLMVFMNNNNAIDVIEKNFNDAFDSFGRYQLINPSHNCAKLEKLTKPPIYACKYLANFNLPEQPDLDLRLKITSQVMSDKTDFPAAFTCQFRRGGVQLMNIPAYFYMLYDGIIYL